MKIGLVMRVINKEGGISRYATELAERYTRENEVHIITSKLNYEIKGATIHKTNIYWNPISLQIASATYKNTKLANKLREEGVVDLIHSQGAEVTSPDVITAHSCQLAAVKQFNRERGLGYRFMKAFEPRNRIVLAIEKHNFKDRNIKKAIAVSQNVKDDLMKYYNIPDEDVEVVYNGVNTTEFNPEKKRTWRHKVREELDISQEDYAAVFSGWEFKRKGLMQIINAMPKTKEFHLIVVGGDNPEKYRTRASQLGVVDKLHFVGHVDDISRYYAAADFMLFPTTYEPFGLVITEAMATGIPVITSKCAGAAELITDGIDGLLLDDPHDHREIAEKITYLIENNIIDDIGEKARATAEKYSWDNIAEQTFKVYDDVYG